jgi:very-short-patch-repair endonuclease
MSGQGDRAVGKLAARQKTLVTAAQVAQCGLGKDAVAYRVHSGRLHPVFHGVYSVGCGALPPLALELAALLACGKGSFISHRSAAFVWGLLATAPTEVEVSVVGRCCTSRNGIHVHRIQKIHRNELRRHEGLWISSPARAVLETATTATLDELADIVNEGHGRRLFTPHYLEAVLRRHRGRRGTAKLAQVLGDEDATTITRSRAERAFLKLIRDARLPAPETNQKLGRYSPDFMWRDQRLIVELDSYQFHGGPAGFHNDREKDLVYRDAGFDTLRPTRNHVIHQPARVLVMVVRALARGTAA